MEERERERASNVGLPKEGAFLVEVAETFMRCDKQNMWSVLGTSYSVILTRREGVRVRLLLEEV